MEEMILWVKVQECSWSHCHLCVLCVIARGAANVARHPLRRRTPTPIKRGSTRSVDCTAKIWGCNLNDEGINQGMAHYNELKKKFKFLYFLRYSFHLCEFSQHWMGDSLRPVSQTCCRYSPILSPATSLPLIVRSSLHLFLPSALSLFIIFPE